MVRTASVCTLCVLALSAAAQADVLNLAEAPDYSGLITAPTALPTFVIGTNTVSGHLDFNAGDISDAFLISLPGGASLTSVTLTISNFTYQSPFGNWGSFSATGPVPAISTGSNGTGNGTLVYSSLNPVSLSHRMFGSTAGATNLSGVPNGSYSSYDYTWTFTVVPTPGAAALIGLATLGTSRRRR